MRLLLLVGCLVGWLKPGSTVSTPADRYTHVKFAKTETLWSVRGFLNVESTVDISLFDHSF